MAIDDTVQELENLRSFIRASGGAADYEVKSVIDTEEYHVDLEELERNPGDGIRYDQDRHKFEVLPEYQH